MTIKVWSTVENNRRRFGMGRPPRGVTIVGEFEKLYDPNTGTTSDRFSYQPTNYAPQPNSKWLYERVPE